MLNPTLAQCASFVGRVVVIDTYCVLAGIASQVITFLLLVLFATAVLVIVILLFCDHRFL